MSLLDAVVAKAWRNNTLLNVLIELTYRCNLDCVFCYNDLSLRGRALSRDQYSAFFRDLRDMNVLWLSLSGGEPLAHPDFFALGQEAKALGFLVKVKSNGHALGGGLARRLKDEVDPWIVETSLHGATAATHDRQTRVPGSFDRLLANIRGLLELAIPVKINSTLTRWNEHELEAMYELVDGLGCPLQVDPVVTPRDDGNREPQQLMASPAAIRRFATILSRRSPVAPTVAATPAVPAEPQKNCGAGSSMIAVDPFGNVYPCVNWRRPSGNLHQQSIREIWATSGVLSDVRQLAFDAAEAAGAAMPAGRPAMGFCPGTAESSLGSPLAIYPEWKSLVDAEHEVELAGNG